jgi:uncharacterized protein
MFLIDENTYEIKQTSQKGQGVFAKSPIKKGVIIGDYLGKATVYEEVEEDDFEYMMFLDDQFAIIPDRKIPGIHLLNHSCDPNCFMYPYKGHMLFVSIKDIEPQEELTISYLYPPQDACSPCDHKCYCQSQSCNGSMHSSKKLHISWGKFKVEQSKKYKAEKNFGEGFLLPFKEYPSLVKFDFDLL